MALTGLDIFKLTPKTNCKDCGNPTCMAFAMKVAQGAISIDKCPHISDEVKAKLDEATAPPMKTIKIGTGENEYSLGGETVLYRHDKTFVSKTLYSVAVSDAYTDEQNEKAFADVAHIDYDRIGERMRVDAIFVDYVSDGAKFLDLVKKANEKGRTLIINCADADLAAQALEIAAAGKPVLSGANASNYEAMNALAAKHGVVLGVTGKDLNELHDTVEKLEKAGNKNLVLDVTMANIKDTFAAAVQVRRAAIKDGDRTFGYPSIVNTARLAAGDRHLQTALAALFTLRYGSIVVLEGMSYADALPLYGLRQNIFTNPQKPMKVEPGIYPINGADENSVCLVTVDFALTYFVVSGEVERSGVPVNLLITDAGGYSVLTAWAAGKLSASSIAKFFQEADIENKIKNRTLVIPGKVAVLKGEIEDKLPGWKIIPSPPEAIQLVKFLRELNA